MDLIEVLWKQDVDLGYNPIIPALNPTQQKEASSEDEIEKLKALLELKTDKVSFGREDVRESSFFQHLTCLAWEEIIRKENINISLNFCCF